MLSVVVFQATKLGIRMDVSQFSNVMYLEPLNQGY